MKSSHSMKSYLESQNYERQSPISDLVNIFLAESAGPGGNDYFHLKDGRFSKIWHIKPREMSALSGDQVAEISENFARVINQFPAGSCGQVFYMTSKDPRKFTDQYLKSKMVPNDSFSMRLAESTVNHQLKASNNPDGFFQNLSDEKLQSAASMDEDDDTAANMVAITREMRQGKFPITSELYLVMLWEPDFIFGKMIQDKWELFQASIGLNSPSKIIEASYGKYKKEFLGYCSEVEKTLQDRDWNPSRVTKQGLVDLLYRIFNPSRSKEIKSPRYVGARSIEAELSPKPSTEDILAYMKKLPRSTPVDYRLFMDTYHGYSQVTTSPEGWEIRHKGKPIYHRVSSFLGRPEKTFPGMIYQALNGNDGDGIVCMNFNVNSDFMVKVKMGIKKQQAETILMFAPKNTNASKMLGEVNAVIDITQSQVVSEKQRLLEASMHIITIDESREEADTRDESLVRKMFDVGYQERIRGDAVIHHCIPGNFNNEGMKKLRRAQPYLTRNLADLCPVFTEYQGRGEPALILNNRQGTPIPWDLFDGDNAAHGLLVGGTGSGKSFCFNAIMAGMYAHYKPKIWLIDKGGSYKSFCESLGGNYIDMVMETVKDAHTGNIIRPTCVNPFYTDINPKTGKRYHPDQAGYEFIRDLLINMMTEGRKLEDITTMNSVVVKNSIVVALKEFYRVFTEENVGKEPIFSDFIPYLSKIERQEASGVAITEMLEMYYGDGTYSALFDGFLDVDWSADITVLETDKMANSPCLSSVLLCLFRQIDSYAKYKEPLVRKKIIGVDEAWSTLTNPAAAAALGGFYRELRKYNGLCCLISQKVADFVKLVQQEGTSAADGIMANTNNFIFLRCRPSDYDVAMAELGLNAEEVDLWDSLASAPPYFSEMFVRYVQPSGVPVSGAARLYASPLTIWTGSSAGSDKAARERRVQEHVAKGFNPQKARERALVELAEEFPYGVKYS